MHSLRYATSRLRTIPLLRMLFGSVNAAGDPNEARRMLRCGQYPPNFVSDSGNHSRQHGFSSAHVGIVQFSMADGSVKAISETVDHTFSTNAAEAAQGSGCRWDNSECSDNAAAPGRYIDKALLRQFMGVFQRLNSRNDGLPTEGF